MLNAEDEFLAMPGKLVRVASWKSSLLALVLRTKPAHEDEGYGLWEVEFLEADGVVRSYWLRRQEIEVLE